MIRLFVAIRIPDDVAAALARLCSGLRGARWVEAGNLHITLRFIGQVDEGMARDIAGALLEVKEPQFDLSLKGLGTFGPERAPRQLWMGVVCDEALHRLQVKIENACVACGLDAETRKFTPHVTLARFKGRRVPHGLGDYFLGNSLFSSPVFTAEEFTLFSSRLSRDGAQYLEEAVYPLEGFPGLSGSSGPS